MSYVFMILFNSWFLSRSHWIAIIYGCSNRLSIPVSSSLGFENSIPLSVSMMGKVIQNPKVDIFFFECIKIFFREC